LGGLAILPLYQGAIPVWYFSIVISLMALGLLIYWVRIVNSQSVFLRRSAVDIWLVLYLLLFLIAVTKSKIFYSSILELFKLAGVILVFLSTRYFCGQAKQVKRMTVFLIILGGLLSGAGLLQYFGVLPRDWWQRADFLSVSYLNHNHFAGFLELVLPISLGLTIFEKNGSQKVFFALLCALMGTAFILTLSRGGFFALTAALIFMAFTLSRRVIPGKARWILFISAILVLCAGLLLGGESLLKRIETLKRLETGDLASLQSRIFMWKGATAVFFKNPWWGTGPGTFEHTFLRFRPEGFTERPGFAHSDFLQVLSDCGALIFVVTTCLIMTPFWIGFKTLWSGRDEFRIFIATGCLSSLLALTLHSFIDFNLHIPANWALAGMAAGLLSSLEGSERIYTAPLARAVLRYIPGLLIAIVISGSVIFGLSDYFVWKAKVNLKNERPDRALQYLTRGIAINGVNPNAHYLRGLAAFRSVDKDDPASSDSSQAASEAIRSFDRAISLNSYEPYYDLHRARAHAIFLNPARTRELVPYYEAAIKKDPNDPKLYYLAGVDLLMMNTARDEQIEETAAQMFKMALKLGGPFHQSIHGILRSYAGDKNPRMRMLAFEIINDYNNAARLSRGSR
jgi:O-antigen ligase